MKNPLALILFNGGRLDNEIEYGVVAETVFYDFTDGAREEYVLEPYDEGYIANYNDIKSYKELKELYSK